MQALLASRRPFKTRGFDENDAKNDPLYRWSKVRSSYEYQANMDLGTATGGLRRLEWAGLVLGSRGELLHLYAG